MAVPILAHSNVIPVCAPAEMGSRRAVLQEAAAFRTMEHGLVMLQDGIREIDEFIADLQGQ